MLKTKRLLLENISKKRESKRDRFIRIVERRVNVILDNLDSLGKCSSRRNYEYSEKDLSKIFGEIEKKTKQIKSMYKERSESKNRFKLNN